MTDNRQLCFAVMADAIHNRNDSSRMKTAPQNQLNVLRIKHVRSGSVREVFDLGKTLLFVATNEMAECVSDLSLQIYAAGPDHATQHAIIVAGTKFEFGVVDEKLLLIDEWLTPDSSRFWPAGLYAVGQSPPSFDKQFVRDYLETLDWNETPPGPRLTGDVIARTAAKYVEGCERLTGEKLK